MGEHTIREVLKRRSDDTQRVIRRRRERATKSPRYRGKSYWVVGVLTLFVMALITFIVYIGWLTHTVNKQFTYDRLVNNTGHNGLSLNLQSTSQFLPNTLLAAADPNFYNNSNFTISPLTSSLVRLFFPHDSNLAVSIQSLALQFRYSRTDILEAYINDAYFGKVSGHHIRGFAAASQYYFNKPFAQLQPQDMALLVALATDSNGVDPISQPDKALLMRNAVLQFDAEQGVLGQQQVNAMKRMPLDIMTQTETPIP